MSKEKYNLVKLGTVSTDIASVSIGGSEQLFSKHIAMLARQWKAEGHLDKFSEEELEEMFHGLQNGKEPDYLEIVELPIGDGSFSVFGHLREDRSEDEEVSFEEIVSAEIIIDDDFFGIE